MKVIDYFVNRADQFTGSDEEKIQHHKYFRSEILAGIALIGGGVLYAPFGIVALIATADVGVRLRKNAYSEKPVSGLVGLLREYAPLAIKKIRKKTLI